MSKLVNDAVEEKNGIKRGKKFESFFENFMTQQEGFTYIDKHCRSEVGEIDYFYRSEHEDHPLWKKYSYLFIECKNWEGTISSKELDHFIRLLEAKNTFNCCGIYLTTSSLSPEALTTIRDTRIKQGMLIIPVDKTELSKLIESGFKAYVQQACDRILAKA